MIYRESTSPQIFKATIKGDVADRIIFIDEETNVSYSYNLANELYDFKNRVESDNGTFEAFACLLETFDASDIVYESGAYYISITMVLPIKEGKDYRVLIYNNDEVVYTGKIYCTNQSVDAYTINKNEYVQRSTENEFIVYE